MMIELEVPFIAIRNFEAINENARASYPVKFDHVAMDNFHAVFTRESEPCQSLLQKTTFQSSKVRYWRLCAVPPPLARPTAMRTLRWPRRAGQRQRWRRGAALGMNISTRGGRPLVPVHLCRRRPVLGAYLARAASCCVSSAPAPPLLSSPGQGDSLSESVRHCRVARM